MREDDILSALDAEPVEGTEEPEGTQLAEPPMIPPTSEATGPDSSTGSSGSAGAPEGGSDAASTEEVFVPSTANLGFSTKVFALKALLDKAGSVVPTKDIMPVLKNYQFELKPGRIRVIATDLELSVIATTEMVSVQQEGVAVFPAKRMVAIMNEADEGELVCDVENGTAKIQAGRTEWSIRLMDGSDYPPLPEIADIEFHTIDRVKFLGALASVRFAAATDTVRPSLMMIDVSNGKMRAADGVRFQQAELGEDFPLDIQIPIGAVDDLVKLLRSTDQSELGVGESDNHLVFRVGADVFIANKLMAVFPDVESILLKPALANDEELNVDREALSDAIKRVRITADPETSAIMLELTKGTCTVKSRDKFGNEATESVDCSWTNADRLAVVNHQFLMDMLHMADAPSCKFLFGPETKTRKSPIMLKDDATGAIGIINQMRADWAVS